MERFLFVDIISLRPPCISHGGSVAGLITPIKHVGTNCMSPKLPKMIIHNFPQKHLAVSLGIFIFNSKNDIINHDNYPTMLKNNGHRNGRLPPSSVTLSISLYL